VSDFLGRLAGRALGRGQPPLRPRLPSRFEPAVAAATTSGETEAPTPRAGEAAAVSLPPAAAGLAAAGVHGAAPATAGLPAAGRLGAALSVPVPGLPAASFPAAAHPFSPFTPAARESRPDGRPDSEGDGQYAAAIRAPVPGRVPLTAEAGSPASRLAGSRGPETRETGHAGGDAGRASRSTRERALAEPRRAPWIAAPAEAVATGILPGGVERESGRPGAPPATAPAVPWSGSAEGPVKQEQGAPGHDAVRASTSTREPALAEPRKTPGIEAPPAAAAAGVLPEGAGLRSGRPEPPPASAQPASWDGSPEEVRPFPETAEAAKRAAGLVPVDRPPIPRSMARDRPAPAGFADAAATASRRTAGGPAPAPETLVRVTIGRIEVRAAAPAAAQAPAPAARPAAPRLTLEEYLRRRGEGRT